MKLDINSKRKNWKIQKYVEIKHHWSNQWVKEENMKEIRTTLRQMIMKKQNKT